MYVGEGGVYTMENKDTNTDFQKVVGVGDRKWEIAKSTIGIIFLFEIVSSISYKGSQFPPQILICPKSFRYKHSEKWLIFFILFLFEVSSN